MAAGALKPAGSAYRRLALSLILILFLVNMYRAWTQSITGDEAFTYNVFLSGPLSRLFSYYEANHHVFHTILTKISVSLFGLSEFTLRIPSLLGGLLFLTTAYRLSRRLFGEGGLLLVSVALVSLNPLLLDHLSAARGYGLALGFCLWAVYQMLRWLESPERRFVYKAALGLALAVSSNLTLLFPCAGLALLFFAILLLDPRTAGRRFTLAVDRFIVPGVTIAFVILVMPLTKARLDLYYVGHSNIAESLRSLIALSLFHHPGALTPAPGSWLVESPIWFIQNLLAPLVLVLTAFAWTFAAYRRVHTRSFTGHAADLFLFLGGGALLIAVGLILASHRLFGLPFPQGRTGLHLIPLFVLVSLVLWKRIERYRAATPIRYLGALLCGLCILQFLLQFQTSHYGEWRYDASTKKIINMIHERERAKPHSKVRVGVNWMLEPSMNFYRTQYRLDWMEPLTREGPDGEFDYYVLLAQDAGLAEKRELVVLHKDDFSTALLAVPKPGP